MVAVLARVLSAALCETTDDRPVVDVGAVEVAEVAEVVLHPPMKNLISSLIPIWAMMLKSQGKENMPPRETRFFLTDTGETQIFLISPRETTFFPNSARRNHNFARGKSYFCRLDNELDAYFQQTGAAGAAESKIPESGEIVQ